MAGIQVKNLGKYYGNFEALNDVSFDVADGEILGLLGPNGAGKTTTMRILTTFLPPSSGSATVNDFDIIKQPIQVRKSIGYMPENPPLYNNMKVGKFLRFVGNLKKISSKKISRQLEYIRDVCKLNDIWGKYISQLSKGYRQRVGFASAIIADPAVLIFDEPTIGLDPKQIRYTRELIKNLGGEHTVILSTHILPEAEMTCDRVAIINRGKILAIGSPAELAQKIRKVNAVKVEMTGPANEVKNSLLELDGVIRVVPQERHSLFLVEFEPKWKTRERITKIALENSWSILELTPVEASLEEVFLEIVSSQESKI